MSEAYLARGAEGRGDSSEGRQAGGAAQAVGGDAPLSIAQAMIWFDTDPRPRLVLDRHCRVIWHNTAAGALSARSALSVEGDRLRFARAEAEAPCLARLREATDGVSVLPLTSVNGLTTDMVVRYWAHGVGDDRRIFAKLSPVGPAVSSRQSGMAATFGLTEAEAAVVDGLTRTMSPSEIARHKRVSIHTVRTQVRRIYAKTCVSSQPELVRLSMVFCNG